MAVLTFEKKKNKISISYQKTPFDKKKTKISFSLKELKELAAKYLMYFNEGKTGLKEKISLKAVCKKTEEYYSGKLPKEFSQKEVQLRYFRKEIYRYIHENNLFEIEEVSPAVSKREARKEIKLFRKENYDLCQSIISKYVNLVEQVKSFQEGDFSLEKVKQYITGFKEACYFARENICANRRQRVTENYGLFKNDAMCIICAMRYYCKKTNWQKLLYEIFLLLKSSQVDDVISDDTKHEVVSITKKLTANEYQLSKIKRGWKVSG